MKMLLNSTNALLVVCCTEHRIIVSIHEILTPKIVDFQTQSFWIFTLKVQKAVNPGKIIWRIRKDIHSFIRIVIK